MQYRIAGNDLSAWGATQTTLKRILLLKPVNRLLVDAVRKLPNRDWTRRVPVAVEEVDGRVELAGRTVSFIMTDPGRCNIAKELFWGRGERLDLSERLALQLFVELAEAADVVLDIGANTGLFAVAAAKANPSCRVHAFEIMPEAFEAMFHNVVRNDLLPTITLHACGIGREGDVVRMPPGRWSSSIPTSLSTDYHFEDGVSVPITSLDVFGPKHLRPGERVLMKIDVENTEGAVFENAHEFFAHTDVDIMCELLPSTESVEAVDAVLKSCNYNRYLIKPDGLELRGSLQPSSQFHDWVFSRRSREQLNEKQARS